MSTGRAVLKPTLVGAVLGAIALACIIIPEDPPPLPLPIPVPQPFPGGDGAGTGVLYVMRVDRSSVNLASGYQALVEDVRGSLTAAGFKVASEMAVAMYDYQVLWGQTEARPSEVALADSIRYYAARAADGSPQTCSTGPLSAFGRSLSTVELHYPEDLLRGQLVPVEDAGTDAGEVDPPDAGLELFDAGAEDLDAGIELPPLKPFEAAPSAFLVVLIDSGPRPRQHGSGSCRLNNKDPASWFTSEDPAQWAELADEKRLPRQTTRFALVTTPEDIGATEMRRRCLAVPSFPRSGLDAIEPSTVPFFSDFQQTADTHAPIVRSFDFCQGVGRTWELDAFLDEWVDELMKLEVPSP